MGGFTPGLRYLIPALSLLAAGLLAWAISGCTSAASDILNSGATPETTTASSSPNRGADSQISTQPTPAPETTEFEEPLTLMNRALKSSFKGDLRPIQQMGASGEIHYLPVLVELLRFAWWRIDPEAPLAIQQALATLVQQNSPSLELEAEEAKWDEWVAWLGEHPEISPPEGFAGWKGRLFAQRVDPAMREDCCAFGRLVALP